MQLETDSLKKVLKMNSVVILYYLFYSSLGILVVLNLFWKKYLTKEVLYLFFFIAGMYAGGKISYYCMRYIARHRL